MGTEDRAPVTVEASAGMGVMPDARPKKHMGNERAAAAGSGSRDVLQRLWHIYENTVLPIEQRCHFAHFRLPPITSAEFEARPQVLLLGPFSTGKTSIVRWLSGIDSSHFDVKPQPSTDKFMAVVHGDEERVIHGHGASCLPQLPYQGLSVFGANFLNNFKALVLPAKILDDVTFIDTPGVLSGSQQRTGRSYDFAAVSAWMAERADLVLLTFDAHKLDISDEFQALMEVLRPYADKVRCVLNKADQIDAANLIRVHGALLWNIGKIMRTPEVARVYISSFWEEKYRYDDHAALFEEDKAAILKELHELPRTADLRKLNGFVERVRQVRAHACLLTHLRAKMPTMWARVVSQGSFDGWLEKNLPALLEEARSIRGLSAGDMPDTAELRMRLCGFGPLGKLPTWKPREIEALDRVIEVEVPALMSEVGGVSAVAVSLQTSASEEGGFWQRLGMGLAAKRQRTS